MSNLMYKIIMIKKSILLSLIEFEKTAKNVKVYYGGVFLARQSLISLNKKVLKYMYDIHVYELIGNHYDPDFFVLSYSGLVMSLRTMLTDYLNLMRDFEVSCDIVNYIEDILYNE